MFTPLSIHQLAQWVFGELEAQSSVFGIPRELFFEPSTDDGFRLRLYGQQLDTPFGVAAGPHSQLAQNIVVAWLCGARFIELKTVQTLDELEIPRPCIDMQDEGYNVEWSQELKLEQSFDAYLQAWVLIHALHHRLGHRGSRPGVIFNMSVGYDMAGLQQPNMQRFLSRMADAGDQLAEYVEAVAAYAPALQNHRPPPRLSDNVTLSTMHGCPPEEIGKLCTYLMEEWGLHTNVKLNPTLLGPERVRHIINEALGFRHIKVPDLAFEHDLTYPDALTLLTEQKATAAAQGVEFGVKLCNTLEVVNERPTFQPGQGRPEMAYLSGRPHHAVAVNVASQLLEDFDGDLSLSFAGGADAWNVVDLLAAGMTTVTTCSDLLRPGGYGRLKQYLDQTNEALTETGARTLAELACARADAGDGGAAGTAPSAGVVSSCQRSNLRRYAHQVLSDGRFKRDTYERNRTKTDRELGSFDCIAAPCADRCPINQQVPQYIELIAQGTPAKAASLIRNDNALAAVLGRACNHACEGVCIRTHYDRPLAIRELKRFAMAHEEQEPAHGEVTNPASPPNAAVAETRVAIVGAGPCGLSTAYFLRRAGYEVTLFEARRQAGGMVSDTIPAYRATQAVIDQDLSFLRHLGVTVQTGQRLGTDMTLDQLLEQYSHVVVATGAPRGLPLQIPGEEGPGVYDGLEFLRQTRRQQAPTLGQGQVGVIGGGDVAMDCARSAARLAPGRVTLIYRRTQEEMPAHREEREALQEEGIQIRELLSPQKIQRDSAGQLTSLVAQPMELAEPDRSGRRRPIESSAPAEEMPLTALIVAIGQQPDLTVLDNDSAPAADGQDPVKRSSRGNKYVTVDGTTRQTSRRRVYAGGDLTDDGPATIVAALGDGKAIAQSIRADVEGTSPIPEPHQVPALSASELVARRARRAARVEAPRRPVSDRQGFDEILGTFTTEAAQSEASRCLRCDQLCSLCVGVCPNRAFATYQLPTMSAILPWFHAVDGQWQRGGEETFAVNQPYQVLVVKDFCNECGNCATFCPTAGRPYLDKPQLFLSSEKFRARKDNAYHVERNGSLWVMEARLGSTVHRLTMDGQLRYESPTLQATLDTTDLSVSNWTVTASVTAERLSLREGLTMYALLVGIQTSLSHLPLR
jgi:putative selenate reductase